MVATQRISVERKKWPITLVGLLLALGVACLPFSDWDHEFANTTHLIGNEAIWWTYIAVMLLYVLRVERRPLSSIGFRAPGAKNLGIGLGAGVLITLILGALYYVVLPALHLNDTIATSTNGNALMATPFWWRFISTIRAAVSEEVLFRGYAMERTEALTGSRVIAVLFSCTIFTLAHVSSWGWSHELIVAAGGMAFSLLYLWRRNLWVNIVAHFIVDAVSVLA